MITLIIVDCQNDFISGSLSVNGAKNVVNEIKNFIKKHLNEIDRIIFTLDWHPYNHSSFKKYGGTWPSHCVQYTPGACIEPKLLKYINSLELNCQYVLKGQTEEIEEYGAFSDIEYVADYFGSRFYLDTAILDADSTPVVCGIAGDYCVKSTIENMIKGELTPRIFLSGIASIDDGTTIKQFIKEKNLEIYE